MEKHSNTPEAKANYQQVAAKAERIKEAKTSKREEILNNYTLKGLILKQVSLDIKDQLSGVVDGIAAEVVSDENVIVYRIDREKGIKAVPFLQWKTGTVSKRASTRGMNLDYVVPEGRSKGLFVSKTNKILVPLLA